MRHSLISLLFVLANFSFAIEAQAGPDIFNNFKVRVIKQKNFLSVGPEVSMISSNIGDLQGFGMNMRYLHAFNKNWAAGASLSQHLSGSSGGSGAVLYTGFAGQVHYAIIGNQQLETQSIRYKNYEIIRHSRDQGNVWTVGASLEQLFLNGTNQVFPATGFVLFTNYHLTLWGWKIKPELAYGALTGSNNEALSIMRATLFINFSL